MKLRKQIPVLGFRMTDENDVQFILDGNRFPLRGAVIDSRAEVGDNRVVDTMLVYADRCIYQIVRVLSYSNMDYNVIEMNATKIASEVLSLKIV